MAEPALLLDRVSKSFIPGVLPRRRTVLHDLTLEVQEGDVFGFLGPNGAGKTTTIKLIVGLLFPDRGKVRIGGRDAGRSEARRGLGFLPENPYFYDHLSGREFLDFYGQLHGLAQPERGRRAAALLERLGLAAAADRPLRAYSKGMVQRLGFAQALLGQPRLLVLDEPMSGLDPIGRRDFRDLIVEARDQGITVFFSSHILQDAEVLCDRVGILADGRLRRVARLEELTRSAARGYEVGLEGSAEALAGALASVPGAGVASRGPHGLVARVKSLEEAEAVAAAGRERGARLTSLQPLRATLEDAFLREVARG